MTTVRHCVQLLETALEQSRDGSAITGGLRERFEILRRNVGTAAGFLGEIAEQADAQTNPDVSDDEIDEDPGADATYTVDISTHPDVMALFSELAGIAATLREAANKADEDAGALFDATATALSRLDAIVPAGTVIAGEPQPG